jgi:hypothetical protein
MSEARKPVRIRLYTAIFQPLTSIVLPMLALLTMTAFIGGLIVDVRPHLFLATMLFLTLLSEFMVGNFVYRERIGVAARIRELAFVILLCYVFFSLPLNTHFSGTFRPSLLNIYPVLLCGLGWLIAAATHSHLREQELFMQTVAGQYGNALHIILRDNVEIYRTARSGILSIGRMGLALFIILSLLLCGLRLGGVSIPVFGFVMYAAFTFAFIMLQLALNSYMDDYSFMTDGVTVPDRLHRLRLGLGFSIATIIAIIALALTGRRSLIPFSLVVALFRWIGALFKSKAPASPAAPQLPSAAPPREPALADLLQELGKATTPPEWLLVLLDILKVAALTMLAVLILFFLFKPLLSRNFIHKIMSFPVIGALIRLVRNIGLGLRELLSTIAAGFRTLFAGSPPMHSGQTATAAPWLQALGRSARTREKQREIAGLVAVFSKLIQWGSRFGATLRPSDTASEFCAGLAKTIRTHGVRELPASGPAAAGASAALVAPTGSATAAGPAAAGGSVVTSPASILLERVESSLPLLASLFEESVYSDHLIDGDRITWFEHEVMLLCRIEPT